MTAGGWPIRYFAAGTGPAMVLVHGLGVSAGYWRRVGAPLAAGGYRVLAPDLPGFGRTPGPGRGLSISEQAEAVVAFMAALELGPAVLVGHSLACQALVEVAVARPELVRTLVLASPTGAKRRHPLLHQALGLLADIPREPITLITLVARAYLRAGPRRLWGTWSRGVSMDPLAIAGRIQAPTLVVTGHRDPVVPVDFATTLAATIPGARIEWIDRAAHGLIFDAPDGFVRRVLTFAKEAAALVPRG